MKNYYFIPVLIAISISSCVVVVDSTSSHFQDELYYSANEYAEEDAKDEAAYQAYLQENNKEEEASNDLKEFGVDSDSPDLFSSENENSSPEDLLSSNEEEDDDLEIPAFLRRQKN